MLRSLDIVEINPWLNQGPENLHKTLFSAERAILSFFGYTAMGTASSEHWSLPTIANEET